MKKKMMRIKLNTPLAGFPVGHELEIEHKKGVPLDSFWRKRLKDAKIDDCISIVTKTKSQNKPKKET